MPYDDEELVPDLTPEEYAEIERQFLRDALLHVSLQLKSRAEAMEAHATIHRAVSQTIIESVIGGKRFIARIWDARTQGTHGQPCARIVYQRYEQAGEPRPIDPSGLLPTVFTAEELQNANAAAEEFSAWLQQHKPVAVKAAVQAFQEIGQRHQSQDDHFEFIFTLDHARLCLKFLRGEIDTWP
jgi:hypothetical protein